MKDDPLKIRDVINVTHNTLHRGSAPLELGDEYWNMRDAIVQAELLIMRMLKFEVTIVHPHKVTRGKIVVSCSYFSNTCTIFLFIIHFHWPTCFDPLGSSSGPS